ncbi:MAG: hypothetical protein Q8L76_10580, partial [Cypionkella sp.]|nr:hypothetical protein [Cypionkella sp.]
MASFGFRQQDKSRLPASQCPNNFDLPVLTCIKDDMCLWHRIGAVRKGQRMISTTDRKAQMQQR